VVNPKAVSRLQTMRKKKRGGKTQSLEIQGRYKIGGQQAIELGLSTKEKRLHGGGGSDLSRDFQRQDWKGLGPQGVEERTI